MFENIERDEERGQVGIGTLIVFIALVLVAAIAAGVLINTAGFLQNQAESTGQESTQQVSNNLNVVSATSSVSGAGGSADKITVTVQLAPGADPIDMSEARIELLNDTLYEASGSESDTLSGSDSSLLFSDGVSTGDTVLSSDESAQIIIDTTATGTFNEADLPEGTEAELTITTPSGAQTTEILNVPDPIEGSDDVRL